VELQAQAEEATQKYKQSEALQAETCKELAATKERSLRRKKKLRATRQKLVRLKQSNRRLAERAKAYDALLLQYNTLVETHNGQLAAYNSLVEHSNRCLAEHDEAYEKLRLQYHTVLDKGSQMLAGRDEAYEKLRLQHNALIGQYKELGAGHAQKCKLLRGKYNTLLQQHRELQRTLPALGEAEQPARSPRKPRRLGLGEQRHGKAGSEQIKLEAQKAKSALWGPLAKVVGGAVLGGVAVTAIGGGGFGERRQKALPAGEKQAIALLPGRVGDGP
jgi:chromosome segregation ATPase